MRWIKMDEKDDGNDRDDAVQIVKEVLLTFRL